MVKTGTNGVGLLFDWNGTNLGVKRENEANYSYQNLKGQDGADGNDGYTPVKGVDYFTSQDKAEVQAPISDQYDSTKTYAVGDYCIYNNTLYRCTGATTGAWNSSKWSAIKITNELAKKLEFETVQDMKKATYLVNGSVVKTLGYYEKNDGGGATYIITNDSNMNSDNYFIHSLSNGLKAELFIENNTVSILQIGGKRNVTNFDNKNYILAYITKNTNSSIKFNLFFPYGVYYTSPVLINASKFSMIGESAEREFSVISAIGNQEYVLKIGDYTAGCGSNKLTNLTFSTAVYDSNFAVTSYHEVSIACVVFSFTYFISSSHLEFANIKGPAFKIDTCWELFFDMINFNHINAFGSAVLIFDTCNTTVFSGNANLSDCDFRYFRFEQIMGDCIHIKSETRMVNCRFGTIDVEPSRITDMGVTFTDVTGSETFEDINCLIRLYGGCDFSIDTILAMNFYFRYYTVNNKKYVFGDFIRIDANNILYKILVNNVAIHYARSQQPCLLKSTKYDNPLSKIVFNNIVNNCEKNLKVQARLCGLIVIKDSLAGNGENNGNMHCFNAIPCYKNATMCTKTTQGLITYDEDSTNPEMLVLACHDGMTGVGKRIFTFLRASNKLYVRAKIDNGATLPIAVYYRNKNNGTWYDIAKTEDKNLVGTGSYKIYEINLIDSTVLGQLCYFQLQDNNVHHYARFDTFIN